MNIQIKSLTSCLLLNLSLSFGTMAIASEDEITDPTNHGEQAHKTHCYKCHTDSVYTRENRFVKSIDALSKRVVRCKEGSDVPWFEEDSDAVVQFLNNKYYRF